MDDGAAARSPARLRREEREREDAEATAGRLRFMRGDSFPALSTGALPEAVESALSIHLRSLGATQIPYYDAEESRIQPGESFERGNDQKFQRSVEYKWSPVGPGGALVRVISEGAVGGVAGAFEGSRAAEQSQHSPSRRQPTPPLPGPSFASSSAFSFSAPLPYSPLSFHAAPALPIPVQDESATRNGLTPSTVSPRPHEPTPERSLYNEELIFAAQSTVEEKHVASGMFTAADPSGSPPPLPSGSTTPVSAVAKGKAKASANKEGPTRSQPRRSARASLPVKPVAVATSLPSTSTTSTTTRSTRRTSAISARKSTPPPPTPSPAAPAIATQPPADVSSESSHSDPEYEEEEEEEEEENGQVEVPIIDTPPKPAPIRLFLPPTRKTGVRKYAKASNATPDSLKGKLHCPNVGCHKTYTQQNGLKYHLKKGRCTLPGTESFAKEAKGKPHVCHLATCGKRYKNRNGLRYHYEHCGPHGVVGIQLFAEERHPRPEGQGGAELDVESENESAISSSAAYSPLPLSTASPALSSKPVRQRPPVRPRRVISTALPLSRIPPTFNDTLLAAQGTEARRPLLVRLDHLCERVGITRAGQAVVCLFCTEEGGTGFEYQWAELEKHMFKQHGYGFEKYCCMTNAERKEVKDGLDQVKALGNYAPAVAGLPPLSSFDIAMLPNPFAPANYASTSAHFTPYTPQGFTMLPALPLDSNSGSYFDANGAMSNGAPRHLLQPSSYDGLTAPTVFEPPNLRKQQNAPILEVPSDPSAYDSGDEDAMGSDDEYLVEYETELAEGAASRKRKLDEAQEVGDKVSLQGQLPAEAKRARGEPVGEAA